MFSAKWTVSLPRMGITFVVMFSPQLFITGIDSDDRVGPATYCAVLTPWKFPVASYDDEHPPPLMRRRRLIAAGVAFFLAAFLAAGAFLAGALLATVAFFAGALLATVAFFAVVFLPSAMSSSFTLPAKIFVRIE